MKKFDKIFLKTASYIGTFAIGCGFACGMDYQFDKWTCGCIVLGAILFACGFIGGEECVPEDEKED